MNFPVFGPQPLETAGSVTDHPSVNNSAPPPGGQRAHQLDTETLRWQGSVPKPRTATVEAKPAARTRRRPPRQAEQETAGIVMVEEEVDDHDDEHDEEPEEEAFDVRRVNGLAVVADEPMPTNLSRPGRFIPSQTIRILTLEDGSQVHACAEPECVVFGTRGDVQAHRWRIHGIRNGKKIVAVDDQYAAAMTLPLGELMEMAQEIQEWQKVFDLQQTQIDALKEKLATQTREHREALAEQHRNWRENHQQQTADMRAELLEARRALKQYDQTFAKLGFKKEEQ